MLSNEDFEALIQRVRDGQQDAAEECVRIYEGEIRRAASMRLADPGLRRIVDSMDICQSVFGRFFKAVSDGNVALENQQQVLNLLITMTRNRVVDEHRRQAAQKRIAPGASPTPVETLARQQPGPRTDFLTKELLSRIRDRLSESELAVADLRNAGKSWKEVAEEIGEPVDTVRRRLDRALQRVRDEVES